MSERYHPSSSAPAASNDHSLVSALWKETIGTMGDNRHHHRPHHQQLPESSIGFGTAVAEDPLLGMQFHDPGETSEKNGASLLELIRARKTMLATATTITHVSTSNNNSSGKASFPSDLPTAKRQRMNPSPPVSASKFPTESSSSASVSAAARARVATAGTAMPGTNKSTLGTRSAVGTTPRTMTTTTTINKTTRGPSTASLPSASAAASLFHQACRLFPHCAAVIASSLEMEPDAACQRAPAARKGNNASFLVGDGKEPFSLPVNILLHHNASADAIHLVATKAPEALVMKDGRDDCCSLIIALRLLGNGSYQDDTNNSSDTDDNKNSAKPPQSSTRTTAMNRKRRSIPEELLAANPEAAQIPDKRRNFPLHVAVYVGASFSLINALYYAYPEALLETNFCGETPLDIGIRNGKCSDESTSFLHDKTAHLKAARLRSRRASLS